MIATTRFDRVHIAPWDDPVLDVLGFDPRSEYCERFWLPSVGPTALLTMRRFAICFEEHPAGISVDLAELAGCLGLAAKAGPNSPIGRTLTRLVQFDLAHDLGDSLAVRRRMPPINRRHIRRLPAPLVRAHQEWAEGGRVGPGTAKGDPVGPRTTEAGRPAA